MGLNRIVLLAALLGTASAAPWCSSLRSWSGAGKYCSGSWLLTCRTHKSQGSAVQCRGGCQVANPGSPDYCKSAPVPPVASPTTRPSGSPPTGGASPPTGGASPPGRSSPTTLRCNHPEKYKGQSVPNVCAPSNKGLVGECVSLVSRCVKDEFGSTAGCSTNPWRKGVTGRSLRKGDVVATFLNSQTGALQEHYYGHVAIFDHWNGDCINVWHQNWGTDKRFVRNSDICKWSCLTCNPRAYYAVTVSSFNNGGRETADAGEAQEGERGYYSEVVRQNGGAPALIAVGAVVAVALAAAVAAVVIRRRSGQTEEEAEAEYTELEEAQA